MHCQRPLRVSSCRYRVTASSKNCCIVLQGFCLCFGGQHDSALLMTSMRLHFSIGRLFMHAMLELLRASLQSAALEATHLHCSACQCPVNRCDLTITRHDLTFTVLSFSAGLQSAAHEATHLHCSASQQPDTLLEETCDQTCADLSFTAPAKQWLRCPRHPHSTAG